MGFDDSLKSTSLEELVRMFSQTNMMLVEAKINNDESMVAAHQSTLEQIQEAIIIKRAENPPLK